MLAAMKRPLFRPLIYVLVIAQLTFALPASAALAGASGNRAAGGDIPCHGSMPMPDKHDSHCPCCPEGTGSMTGCLAQCAGATLIGAFVQVPAASERVAAADALTHVVNDDPADPPLKPPPIL